MYLFSQYDYDFVTFLLYRFSFNREQIYVVNLANSYTQFFTPGFTPLNLAKVCSQSNENRNNKELHILQSVVPLV